MRNETTDLQARLAEARVAAEKARAAADAARAALAAGALTAPLAEFVRQREKLAAAEREATMHADRVRAMEAAAAEAARAAKAARVKEIGDRLRGLARECSEALAAYRTAAQGAWQAAEEIARIAREARELEAEALAAWNNELAERGDCPRMNPPPPDLSRLYLPAAGPDGGDLADERGVDLVAEAVARRQHAAAASGWLSGVRQGAKLAAR
jgi:hypothetical protein